MPVQLTNLQQATLQAVVNRLIPVDEYPNAWDAGVGEYLARHFEGDLKHLVEAYANGLDALEQEAKARYGNGFGELTAPQQDAFLQDVEQGAVVTVWPIAPGKFFRLLVEHTMQGYYGAPLNGGNRDAVSWQMTGFESRR